MTGGDLRRRWVTVGLSAVAHVLVLAALVAVTPQSRPPRAEPPVVFEVALMKPAPPPKPPAPPAETVSPEPTAPESAKVEETEPPPPPRVKARPVRTPPPPEVAPLRVQPGEGPSDEGLAEVSESELASAATAESGGGGGCNMARWLQGQLRKDRHVHAAVAKADAAGKAVLVWNGDWVRHQGQEGGGLAAVREAIQWEVAFAPEACRKEPMRGLVAISLGDGPGSTRLVMGGGAWRWSDLLFSRRGGRG